MTAFVQVQRQREGPSVVTSLITWASVSRTACILHLTHKQSDGVEFTWFHFTERGVESQLTVVCSEGTELWRLSEPVLTAIYPHCSPETRLPHSWRAFRYHERHAPATHFRWTQRVVNLLLGVWRGTTPPPPLSSASFWTRRTSLSCSGFYILSVMSLLKSQTLN